MTESDRERFGLPDFPIHEKLGLRTRHVIAHADRGETYIIRRRPSGDLSTAQILATGQPQRNRLSAESSGVRKYVPECRESQARYRFSSGVQRTVA